jgi:LmbE family N-acetylglucosaminyl deacetylase
VKLIVLAALVACGDNATPRGPALVPAHDLAIVAHQDDDLLFMQPDLLDAIDRGVTILYVTAGNDDHDIDYAERRYDGVMAAYADATGRTDWSCGWIDIAGHVAEHCRVAKLSLVFLGYPDGGRHGEFAASLTKLWTGAIAGADTVAEHGAHYDRASLIATVKAVIDATAPATIRTLDVAASHGDDHSDHEVVAALAVVASAGAKATVLSYRGYNINDEPANALDATRATTAFATYAAVTGTEFSPTYMAYLQRHYATRIDRSAHGVLARDGTCAAAGCLEWRFADHRAHVGDGCVVIGGDVAPCEVATPLELDEEGHVWIAEVPADATETQHLDCLVLVGEVAKPRACGGDDAPTWTVTPLARSTAIAFTEPRLGDVTGDGIADLCEIEAGMLHCAPGDADGNFADETPVAPLALDPASLVLGDLDGDRRADACGRDTTGVACATAASGFQLVHLADTSATSFAIVDGNVCAPTQCFAPALELAASPATWVGNLDGDAAPDWCAFTATGPTCGRAGGPGVPWAYSLGGVVDTGTGSGVLGDLDGDGRADLCTADDSGIACASSHGNAFGPRVRLGLAGSPLVAEGTLCAFAGASVLCVR